jgi:hypothetical protein
LRRSITARCLGWLRGWGLAAFASSIGVVVLGPGTLCLGADGHVAIEAVRAGRCIDAAAPGASVRSPAAPELSSPPPAGDCGQCTDLSASSAAWIGGMRPGQADAGPALAEAAALPTAVLPGSLRAARPPVHEGLAATRVMRGTLLRC